MVGICVIFLVIVIVNIIQYGRWSSEVNATSASTLNLSGNTWGLIFYYCQDQGLEVLKEEKPLVHYSRSDQYHCAWCNKFEKKFIENGKIELGPVNWFYIVGTPIHVSLTADVEEVTRIVGYG